VSNEATSTQSVDTTSTTAPTKAEQRATELKAKREAKEAAKAKRKAENAEKRANGVIGTLRQMLQRPEGATKKEVLASLTEKFPERDPIGMATTVGIQLSRLQKAHGKIVSRKQGERGLVYGFEATVKFAPESSEGAPDKVAVAAAIAEQQATEAQTLNAEAAASAKGGKGNKGGKKR
jgi:hypothetical protein